MFPIWSDSRGNCTNDFLQYQMPLPNVCTSYCFLFLLRVWKTVLTNCLYFRDVNNHHINIVEFNFNFRFFFQSHWLIQFISFIGRLWNGFEQISKAGQSRQRTVISAPLSPPYFCINENMEARRNNFSFLSNCPSAIQSFNPAVFNIV